MTKEEYMATQQQVLMLASLTRELPLEDLLDWISRAESVGPVMNPTLYMQARGNMELVKELARALLTVKKVLPAKKVDATA